GGARHGAGCALYSPFSREDNPLAAVATLPRISHLVRATSSPAVVGGRNDTESSVGFQATEIYQPAASSWSPGPILQPAWIESTVTLLGNGKVLIFGGADRNTEPVSTVMLFE